MMIIKMQLCTKAYHYIRLYSQLVDLYNMPLHGIICEEQPVSEDFTLQKKQRENAAGGTRNGVNVCECVIIKGNGTK